MGNRHKKLIILLAVLYVVVNLLTIKDGHNWCSDFGQYLGQAENIIEGRPYGHTYFIGRPVVTPPGFSLILIPFLKYSGLNFRILKFQNVFFFLGFILLLYAFMRKHSDEKDAILGALLLLTSPDFFIFKQHIMSDVPFLSFITASIFFWIKYEENKQTGNAKQEVLSLSAATILMCFAFFIRWAGMALFISMTIYFLHKKADRKAFGLILLGFIISIFIQKGLGTDGSNYYHEVARPLGKWIMMSYGAMAQTIKTILIFFFPCRTQVSLWVFAVLEKTVHIISPLFFVAVISLFCCRIRKKSLTVIESFCVVYLAGNLLWYFIGGTRYLYPVIGFVVLFLVKALTFSARSAFGRKWFIHSWGRLLIILLIFHNVVSILLVLDYDDDQIGKKDARAMIEWLKTHTQEDERLVFGKPRELGFLTKRYATSYHFLRDGDLCQRIRELNVRYFVFEDYKEKYICPRLNLTDVPLWALAKKNVLVPFNIDTGQLSLKEITACGLDVRQVWGGDREYKIYKIVE